MIHVDTKFADVAAVGVSSREPAYPIFASHRSRSRRGSYLLVFMVVLVVALALRLL
ncbi:MAG TPA: hypothetical protein VFW41_01240 [Gaiellaceae bacterium]|nr:hypothetical protein [Gaiellaceae bacterium]